jgi:RNA polymerase sigma factor (sigma-70 family)
MTVGVQERPGFDSFFECTYPGMLARAIAMCGHRENAEDAVQEAYTEALRRWERVGDYDSAEAWVYRVMTQRLWKDRRIWARAAADLVDDIPVNAGPEQAAEVRDVLWHLACLPPSERAALVLHCLQGLSQQEVADELGVKRGTVAASIFQARRKLAEAVGIPRAGRRESAEDLVAASLRNSHTLAGWADDPLTAVLEAVEGSIRAAIEADPEASAAMLAEIRAQAAAAPAGGGRADERSRP